MDLGFIISEVDHKDFLVNAVPQKVSNQEAGKFTVNIEVF